MSHREDAHVVLSALRRSRVSLELRTLDVCFLAALHLRADRMGLASFREDELLDVFEQVVALGRSSQFDESETAGKRASSVIKRLREQKLLVRVDSAGVVRAGHYALSRLATGIVAFYIEDEALTRQSLEVIAASLALCLENVRNACTSEVCADEDAWQVQVVGPLRVTLVELAGAIERRQRGFDLSQEVVQRDIRELLSADWFGAVERCTQLLDTTSAVLRELNEILMRYGHTFGELLHEILESAERAQRADAQEAARVAMDQVDRIAAWGSARQRAWSDYHEWVHRYLRDVVRLDPSRTLVHRLREQLAGKGTAPFALNVASAAPFRVLRPEFESPQPAPVRRPKKERDKGLDQQRVTADPDAALRGAIAREVDAGASDLSTVTARMFEPELDVDAQFHVAGRVARLVPEIASVRSAREREWRAAGDGIVVEDWTLGARMAKERVS